MLSIITLFIAATVIFFLNFIWQKIKKFDRLVLEIDKIPGPKPVPIFGNTWTLPKDPHEFVLKLGEYNKKYGQHGIFRLWFGYRPNIFLTKGEATETLLNSNTILKKSSTNYDMLGTWLGQGLLISGGERWRAKRKMLTPIFLNQSILNNYVSTFNEQAHILITKLKEASKSGVFDIHAYINRCSLDIIGETAMGIKIQAQTNPDLDYVQAVKTMSELIITYNRSPWLWFKPIFYATDYGFTYDRCMKILKDFTRKVILKRSEEFGKQSKIDPINDITGKKKQAFLDMLLTMKNEQKMSIVDIMEEVDTFMFAGHDATSTATAWSLYLLGHYPRVEVKVFQELETVLGDINRDITEDDLKEMKYLECVIKEAMRIYAPVPWIAREATEEFQIGPYKIPEGAEVNIIPYFVHRDKEIYGEDVNEFRPERFQDEEFFAKHPFAYIPFSAGPRNCVGQKFALMEEKVLVANIVRKFEITSIEPRHQMKEHFALILRPHDGFYVKLKQRK